MIAGNPHEVLERVIVALPNHDALRKRLNQSRPHNVINLTYLGDAAQNSEQSLAADYTARTAEHILYRAFAKLAFYTQFDTIPADELSKDTQQTIAVSRDAYLEDVVKAAQQVLAQHAAGEVNDLLAKSLERIGRWSREVSIATPDRSVYFSVPSVVYEDKETRGFPGVPLPAVGYLRTEGVSYDAVERLIAKHTEWIARDTGYVSLTGKDLELVRLYDKPIGMWFNLVYETSTWPRRKKSA
jgi:hypothetical protein